MNLGELASNFRPNVYPQLSVPLRDFPRQSFGFEELLEHLLRDRAKEIAVLL